MPSTRPHPDLTEHPTVLSHRPCSPHQFTDSTPRLITPTQNTHGRNVLCRAHDLPDNATHTRESTHTTPYTQPWSNQTRQPQSPSLLLLSLQVCCRMPYSCHRTHTEHTPHHTVAPRTFSTPTHPPHQHAKPIHAKHASHPAATPRLITPTCQTTHQTRQPQSPPLLLLFLQALQGPT